jgi:hypothetical protein
MSIFDDKLKKHRQLVDLHDGRLKQLSIDEITQRDTLADPARSDDWPASRAGLEAVQAAMRLEEAALDRARQDLENVYAMQEAVGRAVGGLPPEARPATWEEARESAMRTHREGHAADSARREHVARQHEHNLQAAEYLQDAFEQYVARPDVQAALRPSDDDGQELKAELRTPDPEPLEAKGSVDAAIGGVDVLVQSAIWHRVLQQRSSDREERETLLRGDALATQQAADVQATQRAIAKEWGERTPEERAAELAEYGLTPAAPGTFYRNLFEHHAQRLHQELSLDQQQWTQLGLESNGGANPAMALWMEGGTDSPTRTVCHQYAVREVGVDLVERRLVDYERVLLERGEVDIGVKLALHRETLEESAGSEIERRAQELHARYFSELEVGTAPPSREPIGRCDRDLEPPASDLRSRESPALDR